MTAVDTEHTTTFNTKFVHIVLISYPLAKLQLHKQIIKKKICAEYDILDQKKVGGQLCSCTQSTLLLSVTHKSHLPNNQPHTTGVRSLKFIKQMFMFRLCANTCFRSPGSRMRHRDPCTFTPSSKPAAILDCYPISFHLNCQGPW